MDGALRILIASPLGEVVAAPLRSALSNSTVVVAADRLAFATAISSRVRFDVVSTDLIFNRPDLEGTFDGLDVIEVLRQADRVAPILLATQGNSVEEEHLAEAAQRTEVCGAVAKSAGFAAFTKALQKLAYGHRLPIPMPTPSRPSLFESFQGRRGITAGRLAGAIAAGNATDSASLAAAAQVSPNTANKVGTNYLGPIMRTRHEHDNRLPLTQAATYRWCGLHARYIVSWCRRHGHADVLLPTMAAPGAH